MSHLNEIRESSHNAGGRNLGDEWMDWDGRDDGSIREGKGLFIAAADRSRGRQADDSSRSVGTRNGVVAQPQNLHVLRRFDEGRAG